ncbi:phosphatidate cytidylyltransferase [Hyphococcus luteus]|uniref:Phosphatidate cytidylyltransferase n=1 Tax=Hyphococcus luteus TaxID=2058213 RepID=A0A2S7JYS2_9PROT|nr:phosphatidate cytidylyltransferase [Marinicaulis flavus]PQA85390.1 phosphatidate cytidylyltransferase [Marinicaulis flavus]
MPSSIDKLDIVRPASAGPLKRRIFAAAVLIPVVIAAVHAGGSAFAAMVAFAAVIMLFEWARMVERRSSSRAFYALVAGSAAAMYFAAGGNYDAAIAFAAASGVAAFFCAKRETGIGGWSALGAVYIIMPCIALIWLRLDAPSGRALTYLLYGVVWAADTGAFIFGKFIGGPKISHALSPSKTWAGIGGGILGGALVGAAAGALMFGAEWAVLHFFIGGGLGAASVVGDLVESAFKRNFKLKDISGFIPGHGGALDRLDGMIFATSAMTGGLLLYMLSEKLQG